MVQEYFGSAAAVPIDGIAVEKLDFSERRAEAAFTTLGQERQNPAGKKGFAVRREFARSKDRSKASVREQDWSVRVEKQCLITGSKLGIGEDIEGAFDGPQLFCTRTFRLQFDHPHLKCEAEIHG